MVPIPPRSPDLNPIENIFHLVKKKIEKDAIKQGLEKSSFSDFKTRVIETFYTFDTKVIDKTIASMPQRLYEIVKSKGCRTRY